MRHAYVRIEIARRLDGGLGMAGMSKVRVPSLSRSLITIFGRRCDQTKNKTLPLGRGGYVALFAVRVRSEFWFAFPSRFLWRSEVGVS